MKLQHGKLYRAVNGERFRITLKDGDVYALCNGLFWHPMTGQNHEDSTRDLVEEIDESRWIPTTLAEIEEVADGYEGIHVRLVNDRHWQRQVPRQAALAMGRDQQLELAERLLDRGASISVERGKTVDVIRIRRAA